MCLALLPAAVWAQTVAPSGGLSPQKVGSDAQPVEPGVVMPDPDPSSLKSSATPQVPKGYLSEGTYDDLELALAAPDRVVTLNLKYKKLSAIPETIRQFKNLEHLDLAHNEITEIPAWIGELRTLRSLALNNNRIAVVPSGIGGLSNLLQFYMADNPVAEIAPEIGNLGELRELHISGNGQQSAYQPAIMNLKKLEVLRLWNFGLVDAPVGIVTLPRLNTLCLAHNQLQAFPEVVLGISKLTYLNLGDNKIAAVPAAISQLSGLNYLGVYDNPITTFPANALSGLANLQWFAAWGTEIPVSVQTEILSITTLQASFNNEDAH